MKKLIAIFIILLPVVSFSQTEATSPIEVAPPTPPEETMAEFPGGQREMMRFIQKEIKYPKEAIDQNIGGKVYLSLIIKKDGTVENVKVMRGVHPLLDKEAVRVVKLMPKWTPGTQHGKAVTVQFNLPIVFNLK